MMVSPSSMQASTTGATSSSVSGWITTNGYSTRQSVASVTCDTRASPSNWTLSRRVTRARRFDTRRRNALVLVSAPRLDFVKTPAHVGDQRGAPLAIGQQIVLDVRVARDHPDI